jgi:hypothetical protein
VEILAFQAARKTLGKLLPCLCFFSNHIPFTELLTLEIMKTCVIYVYPVEGGTIVSISVPASYERKDVHAQLYVIENEDRDA